MSFGAALAYTGRVGEGRNNTTQNGRRVSAQQDVTFFQRGKKKRKKEEKGKNDPRISVAHISLSISFDRKGRRF